MRLILILIAIYITVPFWLTLPGLGLILYLRSEQSPYYPNAFELYNAGAIVMFSAYGSGLL